MKRASVPGWMLFAGAAAGASLAAFGLIDAPALPAGRVGPHAALVNGVPITIEEVARATGALAEERRGELDPELRERVLERLIDEELIVQYGLESGLAARDPRARVAIASAVIDAATARGALAAPCDDDELEAFYRDHPERFRTPPSLHVRRLSFTGDDAQARAERARRALVGGTSWGEIAADAQAVAIPDAFLPVSELRELAGPTVTRGATELEPGEVSQPLRSASGVHLVQLLERRGGEVPAFTAAIRAQVAAEAERARADEDLQALLASLRRDADVRVRP